MRTHGFGISLIYFFLCLMCLVWYIATYGSTIENLGILVFRIGALRLRILVLLFLLWFWKVRLDYIFIAECTKLDFTVCFPCVVSLELVSFLKLDSMSLDFLDFLFLEFSKSFYAMLT